MDTNGTHEEPTTAPVRVKLGRSAAGKAYRPGTRKGAMLTMVSQMASVKGHSARVHAKLFSKPGYGYGGGNAKALRAIINFGPALAAGLGKGYVAYLIPGGNGVHATGGKLAIAPGTKSAAIAASAVIVASNA